MFDTIIEEILKHKDHKHFKAIFIHPWALKENGTLADVVAVNVIIDEDYYPADDLFAV